MEKLFVVSKDQTALNMGSGSLNVLATPSAVAMAENTCMEESAHFLKDGETTVGTFIEFSHIKPSLVGASIRVVVEIKEQSAKKMTFEFEMFDEDKKIGYGKHSRAIVNINSFLSHIR